MKRIYISGKITGLDIKVAEQLFQQAASSIKDLGHIPVNPMEIVPYNPAWSWEKYMLADIELIFGCDALYMLENWQQSKGAKIEHAVAVHTEKQVYYSLAELAH